MLAKSNVRVRGGARYQTDFELIRGRVGRIDIDLQLVAERRSTAELSARIGGSGNLSRTSR